MGEKICNAITWGNSGKGHIVYPNITETEQKKRKDNISKVATEIYESAARKKFNIPDYVNISFNFRNDIHEIQISEAPHVLAI